MQFREITVYEYYKHVKEIELRRSADFPCINVGKPKRPVYFPLEVINHTTSGLKYFIQKIFWFIFFWQLCTLVPLQRYTKALSSKQRSQLIGESRKKPNERKAALQTVVNLTMILSIQVNSIHFIIMV